MCKKCFVPALKPSSKITLWNLPANQRCAVIGTCISMDQLQQAKSRFKQYTRDVSIQTDYELHSYFVSVSERKNIVSVYLNKLLNKTHQHFIQNCRYLKTDVDIESTWRAIQSSDLRSLSGYFWAILTSKYASKKLKDRIYGDVHMISHIAGQEHRSELQKGLDEIKALRSSLEKKERVVRTKNQLIERLREDNQRLKNRTIKSRGTSVEHYADKKTQHLTTQHYKSKLARQKNYISDLLQHIKTLEQNSRDIPSENIESEYATLELENETCQGDCSKCKKTDLCGKTILYVGGYSRHRSKFQRMTESINGQFYYHDGGMQQSEHQLDDLVKKADAVFCPVDCISHNAMGRIKNLAKSQCKDCVFLKSASLSSFKNEVTRYAS